MSNYTVGSLFAGVGGICLGFKQAGFDLAWSNEIDEYACETYRTNFEHLLVPGDIEKIVDLSLFDKEKAEYEQKINETSDLDEINKLKKLIDKCDWEKGQYKEKQQELLNHKIDVLNGGFPCQAFSLAGERKGFEDERGNLFLSIVKLIKLLDKTQGKPRVLFLENVKNLMGHDSGKTYEVIKGKLENLGYIIKEKVLNTMDYSHLPQNRERIYIVGFLSEKDAANFTLFDGDNIKEHFIHKTKEDRIEDIKNILDDSINIEDDSKYYYTKEKYPKYFLSEEEYNVIPSDLKKDIRINLDEQITEPYQFYQVRRGMYVRRNMSNVCPTLTANMGTGGHNVALIKVKDGIRKITPTEAFRIQGFPVGNSYKLPEKFNNRPYSDAQLYKQAGNAVSVNVIRFLAKEILKVLDKNRDYK